MNLILEKLIYNNWYKVLSDTKVGDTICDATKSKVEALRVF